MDKDNTAILSDIRQLLNELKQQIACLEVKIDALSVGEQTSGDNDMIDLWLDNSEAEETAVTETDTTHEVSSEDTDMPPVEMEDIPEAAVSGQEAAVEMEPEAEIEIEPEKETGIEMEPGQETESKAEPEQEPEPITEPGPALEPEEEPEQLFESAEESESVFDPEEEPEATFDHEENPESVFVPQTEPEEELSYEDVFEPATQEDDKIVEETPVDFEPEEEIQNIEEQDIETDILDNESFESEHKPELEPESEPEPELEQEPYLEPEPDTEQEPEPESVSNTELIFDDTSLGSEEAASPFRGLEPERSTGVGHPADSFAGSGPVTDEPANQNPGEIVLEQTERKTEIDAEPQKRPMTIEEMFEAFFNSTEQESGKPAKQRQKSDEKFTPATSQVAKVSIATDPANETKPVEQERTAEQERPFDSPAYTTYSTKSRRKSLAERLMKSSSENWKTDIPGSPVKDIKSAISLNDRVMMIRSLFDDDGDVFHHTISEINSMSSLDEAVDYLKTHFPSWRWESDNVYKFMMAVRRKLK